MLYTTEITGNNDEEPTYSIYIYILFVSHFGIAKEKIKLVCIFFLMEENL